MTRLRLAISTCPNDTFAFHGLLMGRVDRRGLDFDVELLDIAQLNSGLMEGRFDVAKASFHAALHLAESMLVLPSGSALGFGVGPLLLAARESDPDRWPTDGPPARALCPGQWTTATLLLKLFHAPALAEKRVEIEHVVFSDIMPRLKEGSADFGVCIHEGRFTWRDQGLFLVEDLGQRWETATDCPLPLGGILASRALPAETLSAVQQVISDSITYGLANRQETAETMRRYAQEFDDDVLFQHVDLYVNDWTRDLGEVGRSSLAALSQRAQQAGLLPPDAPPLEVWG